MKRLVLRKMLQNKQLFVPCVYDCYSAKVAEMSGYKAALLSGGALSYSLCGLPDMAFLTSDELIFATERIASCTDLPLIVDADDGYGESPVVVYNTVKRLVKAGAQAVTIDDSTGIRGFERYVAYLASGSQKPYLQPVVSRKVWLAKIKAAVEACQGTDCMVIARTEAFSMYSFDEVMERCLGARELGAEMTLICDGMETLEDAKRVNDLDKGWKMWPDVYSVNGKPNVDLDDIGNLGFNLVTFHVFEKAALYGMMLYGKNNAENHSTVFSEAHFENQAPAELHEFLQKP